MKSSIVSTLYLVAIIATLTPYKPLVNALPIHSFVKPRQQDFFDEQQQQQQQQQQSFDNVIRATSVIPLDQQQQQQQQPQQSTTILTNPPQIDIQQSQVQSPPVMFEQDESQFNQQQQASKQFGFTSRHNQHSPNQPTKKHHKRNNIHSSSMTLEMLALRGSTKSASKHQHQLTTTATKSYSVAKFKSPTKYMLKKRPGGQLVFSQTTPF
ncbi:hypothetical protein GQ42DRAFT_172507 [Ramicandelaber brevisporus]|nr:hypothetical protein GQ42DRAFT_172507 [Ramicandelaber brevisporus]